MNLSIDCPSLSPIHFFSLPTQAKIEHTRKKIELTKGVRQLEWEEKWLALEREQLMGETREVQMFRVQKSATKVDPQKESETLERTKEARARAHRQAVAERKKRLRKLQRDLEKKAEENTSLEARLSTLQEDVGERAQVRKVQLAAVGDGGAAARLRRVQERRQLMDLVNAQGEDMKLLQEEVRACRGPNGVLEAHFLSLSHFSEPAFPFPFQLERLRMKTFPSFGPHATGVRSSLRR